MNPKEETIDFKVVHNSSDEEKDDFLGSIGAERIFSSIIEVNEEVKEYANAIAETGNFDTSFLGILQTKNDWRYLMNKVTDFTVDITVSDPNELWCCAKHFIDLYNQEYDDSDDASIIEHRNIEAIKEYNERIVSCFINQMSESSIVEILEYCSAMIKTQKKYKETTVSLLLNAFEYETLPSKLVLPIAFSLKGKPFVKSYILIAKKYPFVPLNAYSFFTRIIDVNEPICFKALGCGSFSDNELIEYKAIDYAFDRIREHINSDKSSKDERVKDEQWVGLGISFITDICKRIGNQSEIALVFLEIAKEGSIYVKLKAMDFFDEFLHSFDEELVSNLLKSGLLDIVYSILTSTLSETRIVNVLKLLSTIKSFLVIKSMTFSDYSEEGLIDEDELYEVISGIIENTESEYISHIASSILPNYEED